MIDIHFEDSSTKKFVISPDVTVGELVRKIEAKMHLTTDLDSFALFESRTVGGTQVGFPSHFRLYLACFKNLFTRLNLDSYLNPNDKCPRAQPPSFFLFKKRFFFQENSDPDTIHMEFIQVCRYLSLNAHHLYRFVKTFFEAIMAFQNIIFLNLLQLTLELPMDLQILLNISRDS